MSKLSFWFPISAGAQPWLKSWGGQGLGPNTGTLAPSTRLGVGCGRGSPPSAVRVRGITPGKIYENSDAKSCILVTTCYGLVDSTVWHTLWTVKKMAVNICDHNFGKSWQLFPGGLQSNFQLMSCFRLRLEITVLFLHDALDMFLPYTNTADSNRESLGAIHSSQQTWDSSHSSA